MARILIAGTGTGIGKTHVTCALLRAARLRGIDAIGLKPIETGVGALGSEPGDHERLAVAAHRGPSDGESFHVKRSADPFHVKRSAAGPQGENVATDATASVAAATGPVPIVRPLYAFTDPISPHLAALRAGIRFDLGAVRQWVLASERSLTFVETAGGLFSPLDAVTSNLDLVNALRPAIVVLVAPDRLGVLHEVTATVGLAAARGWSVDAVVLSAPDRLDASTGTNADSLASLGIARPIASFPRAHEDDPASRAAADLALDQLAGLSDVTGAGAGSREWSPGGRSLG